VPVAAVYDDMSSVAITNRSRHSLTGLCPFCGRKLPLTFHHLIPRKVHRRPRYRQRYSRDQLARGIYLCRDCHDGIHDTYSEVELASTYFTPDRLAADPALARHFAWLSRQRRSTG